MHRFFVLAWYEFLDDVLALDSWQLRSTNIKSIFREVLEAIRVAEQHESSKRALDALLSEAIEIAQNDPVLNRHYAHVPAIIRNWTSKDLVVLDREVQVILGSLSKYHDHVRQDLRAMQLEGNSKYKYDTQAIGHALAVAAMNSGYSIDYLKQGAFALIDSTVADVESRIDNFLRLFKNRPRPYLGTFALTWVSKQNPAELSSEHIILRKDRPPGPMLAPEDYFYSNAGTHSTFADVTVSALDPFAARLRAEERLGEMLAALRFYEVRSFFAISLDFCLVSRPTERPSLLGRAFKGRNYLRNSNGVSVRVARVVELQAELEDADRRRLTSALHYHNLGLNAPTQDACLVNLWIALESLCEPLNLKTSIIDRVCYAVPSSVSTGYVRRLVSALAGYLRSYRNAENRIDIDPICGSALPGMIDHDKLAAVLAEPADGERIGGLLRACGKNPLLRFRIFNAASRIMSSPRNVRAARQRHEQHVDWQLRRIYRARNAIMHGGKQPRNISQLIQHLHTYLAFAINNLIHDLRVHGHWTIADALEYRRMTSHFLNQLLDSEKWQCDARALLEPTALMHGQ